MQVLDLTHYAFRKRHGAITAYGTWIKGENGWRPCLALVRTGDELGDFCVPCVVLGDRIYLWSEEAGDEAEAGKMCASFIDPLRMSPSTESFLKILSVVRFHIGDVVSIPPRRENPDGPKVEGIIRLTNPETGVVKEREVSRHV